MKDIFKNLFAALAGATRRVVAAVRLVSTAALLLVCGEGVWAQSLRAWGPHEPPRETRGVWVATVGNMDWPSKAGLKPDELKRQTIEILDNVKNLGLNTVFLQVRPASDVIYKSRIEPLSQYLTGGRDDLYADFDPLKFWIDEAHRRGLELHAWINPFRVTQQSNFQPAPNHIMSRHPEWVITYDGKKFLDPGIPEARKYVCGVVREVCQNYDIDGVHFDDYFYPYPSTKNKKEVFCDTASFRLHNPQRLGLDDWRRQNVTKVIRQVQHDVKRIKPWLAFGISPFGVWMNKRDHPDGSETRAGITNYGILYADVRQWALNNWIDYVAPQIYWESGNRFADFDTLTKWWGNLASEKTQIFVGHAVYKINKEGKTWGAAQEMQNQIRKVQADDRLSGSVFFRYAFFRGNLSGLQEHMRTDLYAMPALTTMLVNYPEYCAADSAAASLEAVNLKVRGDSLVWDVAGDSSRARFFIVYKYPKGEDFDPSDPTAVIGITGAHSIKLEAAARRRDRKRWALRVSPVDVYRRVHPPSKRIVVKM